MFCSWPGPKQRPVSLIDSVNASGTNDVLDDDVVGAGAAQADDVPDVDDLVVLARHHERLEVDDLALGVEHQAAEQHPGAVVAAGGEAPLARQRVAALGQRRPCRSGRTTSSAGSWCRRPRPPAAPRRRTARPATGARRPRWRPSRSSRRRRRCRGPRCRSRPGRPRGRRTACGWSSRKNPVSSSSLIDASGTTRSRSASSARSRKVGSRSRTPSRTAWLTGHSSSVLWCALRQY